MFLTLYRSGMTKAKTQVQAGELQNLQEAGIRSIDLNYVSTNIEINGNLLSEASHYTDEQGNRELAADVKDTRLEIGDIPGFTVDEKRHKGDFF